MTVKRDSEFDRWLKYTYGSYINVCGEYYEPGQVLYELDPVKYDLMKQEFQICKNCIYLINTIDGRNFCMRVEKNPVEVTETDTCVDFTY